MKKIVHIAQVSEISATTATPDTGFRKIYPKSDGWYDMDATGAETKIGGVVPGTENFVSKYTTTGLADSLMFDDGNFVGIGTTTWDGYSKMQINGGHLRLGSGSQGLWLSDDAGTYTGDWTQHTDSGKLAFTKSGIGDSLYLMSYGNSLNVPSGTYVPSTNVFRVGGTSSLWDSSNYDQYKKFIVRSDNTGNSSYNSVFYNSTDEHLMSIRNDGGVTLGSLQTPTNADTNVFHTISGGTWLRGGLYVGNDIENHTSSIDTGAIRMGRNSEITFYADYSGSGQYGYGGQIFANPTTGVMVLRGGVGGMQLLGGQTATLGIDVGYGGNVGVGVASSVGTALIVKGAGTGYGTLISLVNSAVSDSSKFLLFDNGEMYFDASSSYQTLKHVSGRWDFPNVVSIGGPTITGSEQFFVRGANNTSGHSSIKAITNNGLSYMQFGNDGVLTSVNSNNGIGMILRNAYASNLLDATLKLIGENTPAISFSSLASGNKNWAITKGYTAGDDLEFIHSSAADGNPAVTSLTLRGDSKSVFAGTLGIGVVPTAMFEVKSTDNSSSTYMLKAFNSDSTAYVQFRNDGYSEFVAPGSAGVTDFAVRSNSTGPALRVVSHYGRIYMGIAPTVGVTGNYTLSISDYGLSGFISFGDNGDKGSVQSVAGYGIKFEGKNTFDSQVHFRLLSDEGYSNQDTTAGFLKNVSIGSIVTPLASVRTYIKGSGNTASSRSLLIANSDYATAFEIYDDRTFNFTGQAPTENSANRFTFTVPSGAAASWYSGLCLNFTNNEPTAYFKGLYIQTTGAHGYALNVYNNTSGLSAVFGTPDYAVLSNGTLFVNTAELQVKGATSDTGGFGLRVRNSSEAYSLQVRNDGSVFNQGKGGYSSNTAFGEYSLISTITGGYNNTAFGYYTLNVTTSGAENTAIGSSSMRYNTTGYENTAVGSSALGSNLTGAYNAAVGSGALLMNSTGSVNVGMGKAALTANTTGSGNIGIGYRSLVSNTTGSYNTAVGGDATLFTNNGDYNVGFGYYAGQANTGSRNVFIGAYAGAYQTAVSDKLFIDNQSRGNTANDIAKALVYGEFSTTTADQIFRVNGSIVNYGKGGITTNSGFGLNALRSITTGAENAAFGNNAGQSLTTGLENAFFGYNAGSAVTTGYQNVHIGALCQYRVDAYQNTLVGMFIGGANTIFGNGNVALGLQTLYNGCGDYNTVVGMQSFTGALVGSYNVGLGYWAGKANAGSSNVFIGPYSGARNTSDSNMLLIGNVNYGSDTEEKERSLIYGVFAALPANQAVTFNAKKINMSYLPTSAAGLDPGDLWNNSGTVAIA